MNDVDESSDGKEQAKPKEKRKPDLEDYLQSPRKKRRSHVIMAYGPHLNPDLPATIQHFLKTQFGAYFQTYPRTQDELAKSFSKLIKLVIFDDEFCDLDQGLRLLKLMKQKKHRVPVPILFLTARPAELIAKYNEHMLVYHEHDEYANYTRMPMNQILSKIRSALVTQNRRRSRRYKVNLPLTYVSLTDNQSHQGRLLDLSLHGALLKAEDEKTIFRDSEQIKISLPVGEVLRAEYGDYLKLACKVRRVLISGNQVGVSFEHVTDEQLLGLTRYLTHMVNVQVAREARAAKAKAMRK